MAENTVQVGSGKQKRKARWPFIVALVVALVLAAVAGGAVRWFVIKDTAVKIPERQLPEVVEEVQNLRIGSSPEEARKKIDAALNDPDTSDDVKYMLYIQQGSLAKQNGSMAEAIASYEKAAAIRTNYEITSLLGDTYAQAGNNALAIEWYKKAIPLVPKEGNPVYEDDIATLENSIRRLGGEL